MHWQINGISIRPRMFLSLWSTPFSFALANQGDQYKILRPGKIKDRKAWQEHRRSLVLILWVCQYNGKWRGSQTKGHSWLSTAGYPLYWQIKWNIKYLDLPFHLQIEWITGKYFTKCWFRWFAIKFANRGVFGIIVVISLVCHCVGKWGG